MKLYENKSLLLSIIKEEFEKIINEQEEKSDENTEDVVEPEIDTTAETDTAEDTGEVDTTGGGDESSLENEEGDVDLDGAPDVSSTPGFGGGSNFGSDDSDDTGLAADTPSEKDTASTVSPEDIEMPDDPIASITDDVIKMLSHTKQPNAILQQVKHSVQKYFSDPSQALPLIKTLHDTEDIVLRDVAKRLMMFIKGI